MEWLIIGGIVLLYFYSRKKQAELIAHSVLTSPVSSLPSIVPVSSKPPEEGSMQEIAQIQKERPTQENFLENPALRMMVSQVAGMVISGISTGTIEPPLDISSALLMQFAGDVHTVEGQIGKSVGSLVGSAIAPLSGLGFGLGFTGMALGEMIGGAFEESSPFSKAQQAVIAQWQNSGPARAAYLRQKGFTDQQIIKWVSDNKDLDYWYLITPIAGPSEKGLPPDYVSPAYLPYWNDMKMVLSGVFSREEKDWLDNYAENLFGFGLGIENLGYSPPVLAGYTWEVMGPGRWGEIEAWPWGGWRQDYCDLSVELKRHADGKTGAMQVEHMLQTSLG